MLFIPGGASHVPQDVQDRIKEIDPRMGLVPYQTASFDNREGGKVYEPTWRWAVVMHWADDDPRWDMVKYQGYPRSHAFDRLGDIPADAPLDQVPAYLKQNLRPTSTPRHIYEAINRWNDDQSLRNGSAVMDYAEELIQTNVGTLFREQGKTVEKVYQYNPAPKNRLKKGERAE